MLIAAGGVSADRAGQAVGVKRVQGVEYPRCYRAVTDLSTLTDWVSRRLPQRA